MWDAQIEEEIRRCDFMVVLVSPDVNREKTADQDYSFVRREVQFAKELKKPILTIKAQNTFVPLMLNGDPYLDCTAYHFTTAADKVVDVVRKHFGLYAKGASVPITLQPQTQTQPKHVRSIDIMPAPFDWIEVPGGRDEMNTNSSVTLQIPTERYWVSRYPVTNTQFAKFVEAGGYNERKWWTEKGWQVRQEEGWTQPRYWTDAKWNGAEHPVVGVSWYEAVAFCLWLSDVTGETVTLPTAAQWQYAAQGYDGRNYPWGNKWDCKRCNNSVKPCISDRTTPVHQYEGANGRSLGNSPFGVVDMAGNVWEWCLTDPKAGTNDVNSNANKRVLRGGSWLYYDADYFRCVLRFRADPHSRNNDGGFRLALS